MVKFVIHVATDEKGVIAVDGKIPWRVPSDLARFRAHTVGRPVIMGRKTFETLGRPLDRRINIVVTRQIETLPYEHMEAHKNREGHCVIFVPDVTLAMAVGHENARKWNSDEIAVIGGEAIYSQFLDKVDRVYRTVVHTEVGEGQTFPDLDVQQWSSTVVKSVDKAMPADEFETTYVVYDRLGT